MKLWTILRFLVIIVWPFAVYFGLGHLEPRHLVVLLLVVVLMRRGAIQGLKALRLVDWALLGVTGLLAGAIIWSNSEPLLRLYPVVISLGLLVVFAYSLFYPPSLVERIARLKDPDLPSGGGAYTRRVTQIWCGFFIFNAAVSTVSALAADRTTWLFYNGFLSYLLVGLLFAGEWLIRRRLFPRSPVP